MSKYEVTFETKCYEKDWEILIKTDRLKRAIENCNYKFKEKILYINNVNDRNEVCSHADRLVAEGVIDKYIVVADFADEALRHFGIDREDFKGGYYYSIQELVGIYMCKTDYLLHFSSDAMIKKSFDWIDDAIDSMVSNPDIKVANPVWNGRYDEAKNESFEENEKFYTGYGFSDQCYLVPVKDFRKPIYNEKNSESERYPKYGGELFEKRVDAWMRNKGFIRITSKKGSYVHKNHPKSKFLRRFYVLINRS